MRILKQVQANEARRRAQHGADPRLLFFARRALDARALRLVDAIRTCVPGRAAHAAVLARELSFDVWDALAAERGKASLSRR